MVDNCWREVGGDGKQVDISTENGGRAITDAVEEEGVHGRMTHEVRSYVCTFPQARERVSERANECVSEHQRGVRVSE